MAKQAFKTQSDDWISPRVGKDPVTHIKGTLQAAVGAASAAVYLHWSPAWVTCPPCQVQRAWL